MLYSKILYTLRSVTNQLLDQLRSSKKTNGETAFIVQYVPQGYGTICHLPSLPHSRLLCCHAMLLPTNGCSHLNHIPFLILANHSYSSIFWNCLAPNCLWGGALRDNTKNSCEGDYHLPSASQTLPKF